MSLDTLIQPFPWASYSKKLLMRIDTPYCTGIFTEHEAECRDLHLAMGSQGAIEYGNCVSFFWLVDKTDGVIIDARFQVYGDSILIGLAEASCELVIGKNYDQANRISTEVLEQYLVDKGGAVAFTPESLDYVKMVVQALHEASLTCSEIPLAPHYAAPPIMGHEIEVLEGGYPGWEALTLEQKIGVINQVLDHEVRPYIALDAGGVTVLNLLNDREVVIAYSGSCTECHSSTGATLSYIQQVLRGRVHPDLEVIPQF
jgi:NifU-like protein